MQNSLPKASLLIALGLVALPGCGSPSKILGYRSADDKPAVTSHYGEPLALTAAKKLAKQAPDRNNGLGRYANCDELAADLEKSLAAQWVQQKGDLAMMIQQEVEWEKSDSYGRVYGDASTDSEGSASSNDSATSDTAASAAKASDGKTNVQVQGVDESDRFKVGVDQIFAQSFNTIQVIDRASLKVEGSINLASQGSVEMFAAGHKLVVIEKNLQNKVRVSEYQTQAKALPQLISKKDYQGQFLDSRLIGNQLILVLNDQLGVEETPIDWSEFSQEAWYNDPAAKRAFDGYATGLQKPTRAKIENNTISGVACSSVMKRKIADFDYSIAKTITLNIDDAAQPERTFASIGAGDGVYVSGQSLYLLKNKIDWLSSSYYSGLDWSGSIDERVFIRQIGINQQNGELSPLGEGEVVGHIKDRWSLHAVNDDQNLVIATSTGNLFEQSGPNVAQNHLVVLKLDPATQSLKDLARIDNFGTTEDIRSVRYIDDKAYIVTFKKTDPLYAFDLKDVSKPKLLSGLKIPGFSTYMHLLADGRLLGIGFDALDEGDFAWYQGLQVSLFDISNPSEMNRIDNHIYGTRGSNSEVTSNPHAFFYDETSKLIGMPLVELTGDTLKGEVSKRTFSGALMLSFQGDKLVEAGRLTHVDMIPSQCIALMDNVQWWQDQSNSLDVNRVFQIDGRILTLSAFGLKAYDVKDLNNAVVTSKFAKSSADPCPQFFPEEF